MSNDKLQMSNQVQMTNVKKYDLEERSARFGEDIIDFCKMVPKNIINNPLISQLIRSGTSVGANYMEADACNSKKDFKHKLVISKKEAKESMHWLRMLTKSNPELSERSKILWKEAHEFVLIFSSIINKTK